MRFPVLAAAILSFGFPAAIIRAAAPATQPFEILEGDRVLFLGDTLLEREGSCGAIEARMHEHFARRHFTVRNLAFSADTPAGWSRASFDPAAKGFERLREQLALVEPTVAVIGYGMASSLQELTDRSGDLTLNADPLRYGAEPMNAARFKAELARLMDAVSAKKAVRFVLLSPIEHEDLRATRSGLPDPAAHNALLTQYTKAVEELAAERGARFVDGGRFSREAHQKGVFLTENGIHPGAEGMELIGRGIAEALGWEIAPTAGGSPTLSAQLRAAIVEKNDLFFHRWRPANSTYIFGFRKHEQGRNAVEMPQFDPLIADAEVRIDQLKAGQASQTTVENPPPPALVADGNPLPAFQVAEGYQIELWAMNPLLEKPTQMNWDAQGRLWVCSSSLYPMIAPGQKPLDKVLILEDRDHDGKADASSQFAGNLLIPTGVEPDLSPLRAPAQDASITVAGDGCYVGQSTELLYFSTSGGNATAPRKRIVFSGFGTEDTHHIIHTLHWGADARLYFNQSIYIHSHVETPWGVVRLNSGGVFAYDPSTERLEVFTKGLVNPWGHQTDKWNQTFQTDGAGSNGVNWAIPGAMFTSYEGARRLFPSVSPGSYPKFCGLELIYSPHFPADWQGNAITCDFRAHRVVRFAFTDLAGEQPAQAAYLCREQSDFVRTTDVSFRPIDVKMGPDGALYVADWSNPVINHGEVDFRDPRRDHHMGRIWRISRKSTPSLQWKPLLGLSNEALLDKLASDNLWESEQSRRTLARRGGAQLAAAAASRSATAKTPAATLAYALLSASIDKRSVLFKELSKSTEPRVRAAAMRELVANQRQVDGAFELLAAGTKDANPRVRVEAMRAITKFPTAQSAGLVLDAAVDSSGKATADPSVDYAAWLSLNELAKPWTDAIVRGEWDFQQRLPQLAYGVAAIDPEYSAKAVAQIFRNRKIPADGSGPWLNILAKSGGSGELNQLFDQLSAGEFLAPAIPGALNALSEAARVRNSRPARSPQDLAKTLDPLLDSRDPAISAAAARYAGYVKLTGSGEKLALLAAGENAAVRASAFEALRAIGGAATLVSFKQLLAGTHSIEVRRTALISTAQLDLVLAVAEAPKVLSAIDDEKVLLETWRGLLQVKGATNGFANVKQLPQPVAAAGLRAARELGKRGEPLVKILTPLAAVTDTPASPFNIATLVAAANSAGDAARGERVYRRANLACVSCHAIGGAGGKVGPELTSLGASAPLDYIIESILTPAAKVKEGYNAVALTLKDGSLATGIQARENARELFLRDAAGNEQPVVKTEIASRLDIGSMMPAGLIDQLSAAERSDLFAFLAKLGKPGPYDASKGDVARLWNLYPGTPDKPVLASQAQESPGVPVLSLVDGRLLKETIAGALPSAGSKSLYALSHFQSSGSVRLKITGAHKVWLDGKPVESDSTVETTSGVHTLAVQLDAAALPEVLSAQSADARFLGN